MFSSGKRGGERMRVCIYIYIYIILERERERERSLSLSIYIYIYIYDTYYHIAIFSIAERLVHWLLFVICPLCLFVFLFYVDCFVVWLFLIYCRGYSVDQLFKHGWKWPKTPDGTNTKLTQKELGQIMIDLLGIRVSAEVTLGPGALGTCPLANPPKAKCSLQVCALCGSPGTR